MTSLLYYSTMRSCSFEFILNNGTTSSCVLSVSVVSVLIGPICRRCKGDLVSCNLFSFAYFFSVFFFYVVLRVYYLFLRIYYLYLWVYHLFLRSIISFFGSYYVFLRHLYRLHLMIDQLPDQNH